MNFFDRLERRMGWLAFAGFLRYYALLHVLVFVLQLFRPDLREIFKFDRAAIYSGEIWRVVTMFFAQSQFGTPSLLTIVLLFFAINFVFMVGDGLEGAWGSFKTSLFYYTGIFAILLVNFIYPTPLPESGFLFYASAFLAFATLFPKVEILLFMIIPVQVRFLGMFMAGGLLLQLPGSPGLLPFYLMAFANYFIWAAVPALRGTARVMESVKRRKIFNAAKASDSEAFHTCVVCRKTDVSDPQLEFRIGKDDEEYCVEHLKE